MKACGSSYLFIAAIHPLSSEKIKNKKLKNNQKNGKLKDF